jgi:protein gp37
MGEHTGIEWTDHTFNPWTGCTKVSPACDRCYAESWAKRSGLVIWGAGESRRMTSAANWQGPVKWNRAAGALGVRERVFCASLADVFDAEVDDAWRDKLFALIDSTPHLDWQLLTKRPKVMRDYLAGCPVRPNVWLGTTVESQSMAEVRLPMLLGTPAAIHFISYEPALGPLDIRPFPGIDWLICGGESGHGARPIDPEWVRSIRDQCAIRGTAFFFKQWGGPTPKAGGKMLDGAQHCNFPHPPTPTL